MTVLQRPAVVDLTGLTVLTVIALAGFGTVYSGSWYLVMGVAGLILGALTGLAANAWRWPVITAVPVALAALIIGAGPLALPGTTLFGVVPTGETVKGVYQGAIGGWWGLLTTLPPVAATGSIALVPFAGGVVCGLSGVLLAKRSKVPLAPMAAPVLLLGAGILFGIAEPASLLLQGAGFSIVALAWATLRHRRTAPPPVTGARLRSRMLGAAAIIGVSTLAAFGAGISPVAAVAPGDRFVLREQVEPPFDPTEYPSPLSAFRRYEVAMKEKVLFSVEGVPDKSRIRLAVMDDYDGLVWTVAGGSGHSSNSGVFQRVGASIPNTGAGPSGRVKVTVKELGGVWLPTVGSLTELAFTGPRAGQLRESFRYNQSTGVGVLKTPVTLQPGDTYDFQAVMPPAPEAPAGAQPAQVTQPDLAGVPDEIAARAIEWSGSAAGGQVAMAALAEKFKTDGAFSDGTAAAGLAVWPGHSAARLREFLGGDQLVGDAEQYAATFALMARQLGVPARVVLGVIPPQAWNRTPGPQGPVASGDVVGSMVTAWVEVRYAGADWVPLDVTPPVTNRPKPPQPRNDPEGTTEVVQPPIIVGQPPVQQPAPGTGEPEDLINRSDWLGVVWRLLVYAWPVLLIGAIALVLIGLKARRRRRRRLSGSPRHRMAGGWQELLDRLRDYGIVVNTRSTRREIITGLSAAGLGTSQEDLVRQLAHRADAAIYAPEDPSEEDASAYWASLGHSIAQLGQGRPRWRRMLASLNPVTLLPTPLVSRSLLEARR
jgi:hypothetical protein